MADLLDPPWAFDPTEPIPPHLNHDEEIFRMRTQIPRIIEPLQGTPADADMTFGTRKTDALRPTPLPLILPAFFAGYRLRTLAKTPSESTFANVLGLGVVAVSGFSAVGATVAIADVAQKPTLSMSWVGVVWWLVMAFVIERLVMQVSSTKNWKALLTTFLLRLSLSVLIAGGVAEPLVTLFNGPEINNQLSETQAAEVTSATGHIDAIYNARINLDYSQIAAIRKNENALSNKVEHYNFLVGCEAGAPGCSQTGKVGTGIYWAHDNRLAKQYKAQLNAIQPQDKVEIQNLQVDIAKQRSVRDGIVTDRENAIDKSGGFVARMEALSAIEKTHRIVVWETWFLRAFFFFIDMLPLSSKYLRMWILDSPYEAQLAAERRADGLPAKRLEGDCDVEEDGIKIGTRARKDVNRARILAGSATAMDSVPGDGMGSGFGDVVEAWSLGSFVNEMTPHETRPVTVPAALRRAGNVALATALSVGVADALWTLLTGSMLVGTPLIAGTVAALIGLVAFTRGFRRAPAWALRAIYSGLLSSFALPVAVLGLQVI